MRARFISSSATGTSLSFWRGLAALRLSSMLEAVIQAMNDTLRGKEESNKGEMPDYPLALKTGVFLSASNP